MRYVLLFGKCYVLRSLWTAKYNTAAKRKTMLRLARPPFKFWVRWLSTCEFSCASSVSDSFCLVDTALTETVCEFLATVESRLPDSFLSRGYGPDVFLSDSLRELAATSKRFYSAINCRQFQYVEGHGMTHIKFLCDAKSRNCRAGAQDVYSC